MKITGLLSWFHEHPDKLHRTITSTAPLIDELVCLDGRYALFPHAESRSTDQEIKAIHDACGAAGLPVHIHQVDEPFDGKWGGEVAKRAALFRLGEQTAPDWYYVFDADCHVEQITPGWRDLLDQDELHVGTVMVADGGLAHPHPAFFRALPGLTVQERHWRYLVPGGPVLWDYPHLITQHKRVPTFTHIVVEHETRERSAERAQQSHTYYAQRDAQGIEAEPTEPYTTPPQDTIRAAELLNTALSKGAGITPGGRRTGSRW